MELVRHQACGTLVSPQPNPLSAAECTTMDHGPVMQLISEALKAKAL